MDEKETNTERSFTPKDPGGGGLASQPSSQMIGRQLSEPGRFAYAALCAISLGRLFGGPENRAFREQYLEALVVSWLGLDGSVMSAMGAFLSGLGSEGSDACHSILQTEPLLSAGGTPIVQDLASFSVRYGQYDARARVLIRHVCCLLRVSPQRLEEFENTLGERLREAVEESQEESSRRLKRERGRRLRRYLLVGLAAVGGGTAIGVTGGLAAPLVAAGAAAVLGAGGAAALGSAAGIAVMASLFGAAGAGLTGYKMNNRVGAIEEFEFLPLSSGKHLHLTIAVTGWLCSSSSKYNSFQGPWCSLGDACGEQYCLVWESRFLRDLGSAMTALLDGLVSMVAQEALKYTVLAGVVTALTWPASMLAVAGVIDNPWSVCLSRSVEVGKHLAHVLRSRHQGKRPVSLIGFSLGARVIYFCLQELANEQGSVGIVEDVVLLGAPVQGSKKAWERMSKVVAGKMVNGYCGGDRLLGFLYRGSAAQLSVAGLQPVNVDDQRIVNVDLSSVVKGHLDYMRHMDAILVMVGVPTRGGVPGASSASGGLPQTVTITEGLLPQTITEGLLPQTITEGLLPQTVTITEGKADIPDDECLEEQVPEKQSPIACTLVGMGETGTQVGASETSPQVGTGETGTQVGMGETGTQGDREHREAEGVSNGWDSPDICNLLDSLNDADDSVEKEASDGAEEATSSWFSLFS